MSQISNALAENASGHNHYTLTVDVIEHRSFLHWATGIPRLVLNGECSKVMARFFAKVFPSAKGHRSNMAGYLTAGAVSQRRTSVLMDVHKLAFR
jgi:hypothetical protein